MTESSLHPTGQVSDHAINPSPRPVVVLDFGSQFTQLIARRIREMQIFSVIVPCTIPYDELVRMRPQALVLSGGPSSVYDPASPVCDERIFDLNLPVLGICYGLQWMTWKLGGKVEPASRREYGFAQLNFLSGTKLLAGLKSPLRVWNSHGDHIAEVPPGFTITGRTENAISVIENAAAKMYAVEFHPEVHHTEEGAEILRRFVVEICGVKPNWFPRSFIEETVERIREQVRDRRALCALSGGVDSAVAATLVGRAIGGRLTCVFVNNGLLRKNEFERVTAALKEQAHLNVRAIDRSERFLTRLRGVTDPEQKRKIIGEEFIRVFEEEARNLGDIQFLVQGTLYPDVIESVSVKGPAAVIKSHHNVGGLPADLKFKLIEPLRELFKDEVRLVGREMGLSEDVVSRQPFPGPGLAVRIVGEITEERLRMVREADAIVSEEVRAAGLYTSLWQSFAVLLPVSSVGVMGDARTYASTIAVRAVESEDGMTADWAKLSPILLERIATRIVNEVKGVNRVVFDITSKPPGTIEWE
ncbi:MAG TPA: glutamine-hydrolyzing GMP synthase [Terriglobia bacterium]|nr:glutamine-hydrolyzing GMP synthase [Terriglobia bacterium]